jgi:hypothetical protein
MVKIRELSLTAYETMLVETLPPLQNGGTVLSYEAGIKDLTQPR